MTADEIKTVDDETLLTYYRNAKTTRARALGHNKAERNDERVTRYADELKRRGVSIPDGYGGQFNGPGSY